MCKFMSVNCLEVSFVTAITMSNKTFESGDRINGEAMHFTSLAEYICQFGRENKSKMINGKLFLIYTKKTASGCNNQYICVQFELVGGQ